MPVCVHLAFCEACSQYFLRWSTSMPLRGGPRPDSLEDDQCRPPTTNRVVPRVSGEVPSVGGGSTVALAVRGRGTVTVKRWGSAPNVLSLRRPSPLGEGRGRPLNSRGRSPRLRIGVAVGESRDGSPEWFTGPDGRRRSDPRLRRPRGSLVRILVTGAAAKIGQSK